MRDLALPPALPLRPPAQVMRLSRMGASFPTRLSFLPTLLRRLHGEGAQVTRPVWEIDAEGFGHAVYSVALGGHVYSLVAVSSDIPDERRTDRVIAEEWDSAYVLYDGVPDAAEIARICAAAPKQEAARFAPSDLVLSRANKSVRLWAHVVEALRAGRQPDADRIRDTGYLMRTTAVYGNGKFGIADRARIADRPGLGGPFMAEMLTVWLIRGFTHDLVEHLGGASLDRHLKRHLGIGNATGLGMAPFLVSHPLLLDAWMQVRETALARVRAVPDLTPTQIARLRVLGDRVARHLAEWSVPDDEAQDDIETLRREWTGFLRHLDDMTLHGPEPVNAMWEAAQGGSVHLQELVAAFVIEPFGAIVDGLTECMATPFTPRIDPAMPVADLQTALMRDWNWAMAIDFTLPHQEAQFWYVSEAKLEPRLGMRHQEPGAECESPLDVARQVQAMALALEGHSGDLMAFLRAHPEHRAAVRRVQTLMAHPYAEIRDNLIDADCRPIDMLRCKLAYFGAAKFDPKSDRWTRITLAQGAPLADELDRTPDWWLPLWRHMKRSRAELAAHLMKAARGAGLPLAVAEDLYSAAGFLTEPDVADIARGLAAGGGELGALMIALDEVECGETRALTSSLAEAMAAARGWRLEQGKKGKGDVEPESKPLEIPDAIWAELDAFAARTYVAETAASRARGAGAGEIDND